MCGEKRNVFVSFISRSIEVNYVQTVLFIGEEGSLTFSVKGDVHKRSSLFGLISFNVPLILNVNIVIEVVAKKSVIEKLDEKYLILRAVKDDIVLTILYAEDRLIRSTQFVKEDNPI